MPRINIREIAEDENQGCVYIVFTENKKQRVIKLAGKELK